MPNPPITVGELTDVPAPESPINAQFMQEVANRVAHRFASVAAMNASNLANGSLAFVTPQLWYKVGGTWFVLAHQGYVDNADAALQANINALSTLVPKYAGGKRTIAAGVTTHVQNTGIDMSTVNYLLSIEVWLQTLHSPLGLELRPWSVTPFWGEYSGGADQTLYLAIPGAGSSSAAIWWAVTYTTI